MGRTCTYTQFAYTHARPLPWASTDASDLTPTSLTSSPLSSSDPNVKASLVCLEGHICAYTVDVWVSKTVCGGGEKNLTSQKGQFTNMFFPRLKAQVRTHAWV
ncbi:hypothetical protein EGR_00855 [Echinococcus granulosus]|uniref:Uncharacterized protein n=1 Tax=Echinococcus granulosus TaxID=6210 RepID=W6UUF7_ECHGR|nr:hypothetical protein EGR_00855 [Echinococcus granulosus]EUB64311.1 hypothetical protein EGR_00855 [Echinococcus granulosus]